MSDAEPMHVPFFTFGGTAVCANTYTHIFADESSQDAWLHVHIYILLSYRGGLGEDPYISSVLDPQALTSKEGPIGWAIQYMLYLCTTSAPRRVHSCPRVTLVETRVVLCLMGSG